jgi:hypothetical protein
MVLELLSVQAQQALHQVRQKVLQVLEVELPLQIFRHIMF